MFFDNVIQVYNTLCFLSFPKPLHLPSALPSSPPPYKFLSHIRVFCLTLTRILCEGRLQSWKYPLKPSGPIVRYTTGNNDCPSPRSQHDSIVPQGRRGFHEPLLCLIGPTQAQSCAGPEQAAKVVFAMAVSLPEKSMSQPSPHHPVLTFFLSPLF